MPKFFEDKQPNQHVDRCVSARGLSLGVENREYFFPDLWEDLVSEIFFQADVNTL